VFRAPLLVLIALMLSGHAPAQARSWPCARERFEGSRFTVCRYDPAHDRLRLILAGADGKPLRRMAAVKAALGARAGQVRFAMNAGMFDDDGRPVGLYVEAGRAIAPLNTRDGPGNFHLKPNGVFSVDAEGRAQVATTQDFESRHAQPSFASQSGPMLVIGGAMHPAIQIDGPSRNIRNGVGVAADGRAYFVISQDRVSFGRLARLFRDRLECPDALYLDGAVSSLWAPALGRMDDSFALGPVFVITEKSG
jgi:uncharacterized protein YigE (DUF2233 family)